MMKEETRAALERLTRVNARLAGLGEMQDIEGSDGRIKVCAAFCRYFRTELKVPPRDLHHTIPDLAGEILYLSNLRCKEVELVEKWWKKDSGAMLAFTGGGNPLALFPHPLSGYTIYDPESNRTARFSPRSGLSLKPLALAVFRPFPPKPLKAADIIGFMARENIGKEAFIIILASLFAALMAVIPPVMSSQIFDVIIPHTLRAMAIEVVLVLLCFDIANVGFTVVTNISISRVLTKIGLSLEGGIWDRLLGLKISFFDRCTAGELLQKIQGVSRLKNLFSINTIQVLMSALFSFVNIIVLFTLEARITWYVLLMFLGLFTVYGLIAHKNFHYHRRYIETENRAAGFNHQALEGIERIKASHAEERVFRGWIGYEAEKRYLKGRIRMLENLNEAVRMFFQFSSAAAVFSLISGVKDVEVGIFIAYVATFMMLHKGIQRLLKTLNILPEAAALIRSIDPIVKGEGEYNPEKIIPKDMSGVLEVNHLVFHYGRFGRSVLRDISFRVEEGQSLGIIGPSGCGKSTLLKVLLGFYPLAGGKIFYGGYDLETVELRYLRRQMGVVLQHGTLPLGKIFDIITDNNPRIGEERVIDALEKADLAGELTALPGGLYTPLEQCAFSDAELQRLMIARALVQPRRFAIFDEPTRFQDNITQQRLLEHIYAIPATKIIVAQRLATIQGCDSIVVLDQGAVIRQGTFPEVIGGLEG